MLLLFWVTAVNISISQSEKQEARRPAIHVATANKLKMQKKKCLLGKYRKRSLNEKKKLV